MEKKKKSRWVSRAVTAAVVLALASLLVYAWMPKPLVVESAEVVLGPLRVTVDEDGRTRVKDRYVVGAPLGGRLSRIELRAGDPVTTKTVLARILPAETPLADPRSSAIADARVASANAGVLQSRSAIDRAKISLDSAEADLARAKDLVASKTVPPIELERAAADRGKRTKSDDVFDVTSPTAGVILKVLQASEGVVGPGTPLVEVGDPDALEIAIDVLTIDALHIKPGARVTIERWGGDYPLAAHIRRIEPSAFVKMSALGVEESRVNAIVDLDEPIDRWRGLGDGFRVEARILVWDEANVLTVPDGALFRIGDDFGVFVVEGGKVHQRKVKLGRRNGTMAQVLSGLTRGDRVVVHPTDKVVEGVRVVF